jgi:hypothetical protein
MEGKGFMYFYVRSVFKFIGYSSLRFMLQQKYAIKLWYLSSQIMEMKTGNIVFFKCWD